MEAKLEIKFRLKQRKSISARNGGYGFNTENTLITMRVTYNTMRMEFTTGYSSSIRRNWRNWRSLRFLRRNCI